MVKALPVELKLLTPATATLETAVTLPNWSTVIEGINDALPYVAAVTPEGESVILPVNESYEIVFQLVKASLALALVKYTLPVVVLPDSRIFAV